MYWIVREHSNTPSRTKHQRRSPPAPGSPAFEQLPAVSVLFVFFFFFLVPILIRLRAQRFSGRFCDWKQVFISHIRFRFSEVGVVLYGFANGFFIWFSRSRPRFVNSVLWCSSSEFVIGDLSPRRKRRKYSNMFRKLGMFVTSVWYVLNHSVSYLFHYIIYLSYWFVLSPCFTAHSRWLQVVCPRSQYRWWWWQCFPLRFIVSFPFCFEYLLAYQWWL